MIGTSSSVTVENRIEEISQIYETLEGFAGRCQLPEPTRRVLLLVVEELFANIVGHGYEENHADRIELTFERESEDVRLTLRDRAVPFDVSRTPKRPRENAELDDMPVGGLGLFLVHEFARSVSNRREGDVNVTEVRLPIVGETDPVKQA